MTDLCISIPLEPPTVNHYVKHTRSGRHYVTKAAIAFKAAVSTSSGGMSVVGKNYEIWLCIYQGKGSRGDVDNYSKCVLDGLTAAGVIHSDAAVTDLHLSKRRDPKNPRTEIRIRAI